MKVWITVGVILFPVLASAQCTKDVDCKGDRICEKGVCVAPSASPAQSPTNSSQIALTLESLLKCSKNPNPTAALTALLRAGMIGRQPVIVSDGAPVFKVQKPLEVFGLRVLQVSGFDPARSKYRGPGTLPPLSFSAVVAGEVKAVEATARQRGVGRTASISRASYTAYGEPAAEITCFGK